MENVLPKKISTKTGSEVLSEPTRQDEDTLEDLVVENATFILPSELNDLVENDLARYGISLTPSQKFQFVPQILSPNDIIDEDSTGAGGEIGDSSHTFVDIIKIVEQVPGEQYGFPVNLPDRPPEIEGISSFSIQEKDNFKNDTPETVNEEKQNVPKDDTSKTDGDENTSEHPKDPEIPPQKDPETVVDPEEDPKEDPKEDPEEDPEEDPKEDPEEDPKEDPKEDPEEDPKEDPKEDPEEDPEEDPKEDPEEDPKEDPEEDPKEDPEEKNLNNGFGNGDDEAPGKSDTKNHAENESEGREYPGKSDHLKLGDVLESEENDHRDSNDSYSLDTMLAESLMNIGKPIHHE